MTRFVAGVLSALLLATTGWAWHLGNVADDALRRTDALPVTGNEGLASVEGDGEAFTLLLVGSDSRAGADEDQLRELNTGAVDGMNTDTMILVHVPADGSRASFVSLPRDSYVEIPGHGWDKLNAAYAYGYLFGTPAGSTEAERDAGGAQLLVRTVSRLTGVQVDHYAAVDLLGFFELSSVVGGVEVNLCEAVQDDYSGIDLPAGVQTVEGSQALAFVRQRHGLPRGDFDRIVRQQAFIAGMMRKILSERMLFDLGAQRGLVEAAASSVTVDRGLDLFAVANQLQSVDLSRVDFQTIPYVGDDRDERGRYILRLVDQDQLHAFFRALGDDGPPGAADVDAPSAPADSAAEAAPAPVVAGMDGHTADDDGCIR